MRAFCRALSIFVLLTSAAFAQEAKRPIGIFEDHFDFGTPDPPGDATYNSETGEYQIIAGGEGDTTGKRSGHAAVLEVSGDLRVKATAPRSLWNQITPVRLTRLNRSGLLGEVQDSLGQ